MAGTRGGSLKSLRRGNRERVIALLREYGSLHRAELARQMGLSRSAVSMIVSDLIDEGLVVEGQDEHTMSSARGSGRRTGLTLNPGGGVVAGLDFDQIQVACVLSDLRHEVVADEVRSLVSPELSWRGRLEAGVELLDELLERAGIGRRQLISIGLGVPGPAHVAWTEDDESRKFDELWEGGSRAAEWLSEIIDVPIRQDNTSHLAALSETTWGAARGCRNVMYVKFSRGIHAGILIDGRLYRGTAGGSGHLGHLSIDPDGRLCECGGRGCLGHYVSIKAILRDLRPGYGDLALDTAIEMAKAGERGCIRVFREAASRLGYGLAGACNLLNPERVVIGGALGGLGDLFVEPAQIALEQNALPIVAESVRIVPGELGERAGALGGVALMLRTAEAEGTSQS